MAKELHITQVRSSASTLPAQRATLRALGLRKISDHVAQADNPAIRGMIATVKHLVRVEEAE